MKINSAQNLPKQNLKPKIIFLYCLLIASQPNEHPGNTVDVHV